MLEYIIDLIQKTEILKEKPVWLIFTVFILAVLFKINSIIDAASKIFNSSLGFSDKIYKIKLSYYTEIYNSDLACEDNKNIAKKHIDEIHFQRLTGIDTNQETRRLLILLATN